MHEMGIAAGILEAAMSAASDTGATRIEEVRVTIGELTEVAEFALRFAFESLTPGTVAESAALLITHVSPRSRCDSCGAEYDHDRYQMLCPACGGFNTTLLQGHELRVDSIRTED